MEKNTYRGANSLMSFLIRVWIPLLSVPLSWSNYLPVVLLPNAIISRVKISIYEVGSWGGVRAWGWRTQHSVYDSDLNDSDVVVKAELNHNWRSQWKVRKWAMNWSWLSINVSIYMYLCTESYLKVIYQNAYHDNTPAAAAKSLKSCPTLLDTFKKKIPLETKV